MFANTALHDETHLRVLRLLQANPKMQQRELAATLGVSLGKANFCLQALRAKGWLKLQSFMGKQNKLAYAYLLTPTGVAQKTALTVRFIQRKQQEYEALKAEIDALTQEAVCAAAVMPAVVIPGPTVVIPAPAVVIPAPAVVIPAPAVVIPGSTRDPGSLDCGSGLPRTPIRGPQ